jgi:hypothetical protein
MNATQLKTKRNRHVLVEAPRHRFVLGLGGTVAVVLLLAGAWRATSSPPAPGEAPEAEKVLAVQASMPFQILIPAYLPEDFNRAGVEIKVNDIGPGGEPMVQLTYRTRLGATLFIREWVPINPEKEILAGSRPIQTKWGQGWLLRQGEGLLALWVNIGPLRASIYTTRQDLLSQEKLLAAAETMGPASNRQAFSFIVDPPEIRQVEPPLPVEIAMNAEGVQEVDLIVTPGGYSPLRFAVKKGVPVRLTFRQLGQVGCGNELNFPTQPDNYTALTLTSPADKQVLEFTPQVAGEFQFFCGHLMYRGVMTVRE